MSTPFLIDDFEFSSISHYHKASQFYNRLDLSIDKKLQYNDLFIRLSRDYRGLGGLGNIEPKFLVEILDNIALKKPFNWNLTFNGYRSLSSVYLSKAYYTKFNNNPELKAALISTYPAKIIERVGKYTFKTNYELMLARYYIVNGETPEFAKFNYNSLIRSDFNMKNKDKTIREHELLLRVFLENKAFENKLAFVDNTILLDDYIKLDVKGATKPNIIENYIHELLFKYNSVYIHSKLTSYIYDTKQSVINLDRFLKSNPDIDIKYHWIVSFYFEYILTSLRLEKQRLVDEAARLEESAKLLEQSEMASIKNKYEILRRLLKGNGYLLVDIPAIKDNIYHAVMDSLIRVDIFPFNFKNSLDTRNKANSKKFLVKNQIFDDKEYVVYENAVELLGNLLAKLFELNKPGQELELSIEDLLTLVSRLFGIDIKVISENEFVEIDFNKSLEMYPKMIDGYKNHTIAQTGFVLGHIDDTDYYFSSRPDVSQNTELLEYLYEPKSGVLIQEINDEHRIIGVWDPINIILDTTRHVDISMLLDGDIDVDIFQLYKIGERIYYKERELYIS
jgi:hypothetical protein